MTKGGDIILIKAVRKFFSNRNFIYILRCVLIMLKLTGPLDNTVNEFWKMVWQCDCGKIIMLTKIFEEGKVTYFPTNIYNQFL